MNIEQATPTKYKQSMGRGGVGVCSVPCNRKVAGSNLPQAEEGRQQETTSLISSPGGVKANEPAFGQRIIIMATMTFLCNSVGQLLTPITHFWLLHPIICFHVSAVVKV